MWNVELVAPFVVEGEVERVGDVLTLRVRGGGCGLPPSSTDSFDLTAHSSESLRAAIDGLSRWTTGPQLGIPEYPATGLAFPSIVCPSLLARDDPQPVGGFLPG